MKTLTRSVVVACLTLLLIGTVGSQLSMPGVGAQEPEIVIKVQLNCGDEYPTLVGVLGQLTLDGQPVAGTVFRLFCDEEGEIDVKCFLSPCARGVEANGAQIAFIRGTRDIVVFSISPNQFKKNWPYTLPLLPGQADPPGEAAIEFF